MDDRKATAHERRGKNVTVTAQPGPLKKIGGSRSHDWNKIIADQAIGSLWLNNSDERKRDRQISAVFAGLIGIGPKDELEGMMAAQLDRRPQRRDGMLPARHDRRADLRGPAREPRTRRTSSPAPTPRCSKRSIAIAARASRRSRSSTSTCMPAARRWSAWSRRPGGGDRPKSEDQPHAKQIAHAPQPAMRSADTEREPVPIASDAERSLPNARRKVAGRAEG